MDLEERYVTAMVQKVIPKGNHGPFAVTAVKGMTGSVTLSLEPTVWRGGEWPEEGMYVVLGKLRKKRAGWRAKYGRYFKPSDEQKAIEKGASYEKGQGINNELPDPLGHYDR